MLHDLKRSCNERNNLHKSTLTEILDSAQYSRPKAASCGCAGRRQVLLFVTYEPPGKLRTVRSALGTVCPCRSLPSTSLSHFVVFDFFLFQTSSWSASSASASSSSNTHVYLTNDYLKNMRTCQKTRQVPRHPTITKKAQQKGLRCREMRQRRALGQPLFEDKPIWTKSQERCQNVV